MINTFVFSSDEKRILVSVGQDRSLKIWDLRTKTPKKSPSITSVAIALDINKIDTHFATGHKNGDVKLWSLSDGKEVTKAGNLHSSPITSLRYAGQ